MGAQARSSGPSRRIGVQTVAWLVIGLVLLGGAVVALYSSTRNDRLAAYGSAPLCASLASANEAADCRYITTGTVTQVDAGPGETTVYLGLPGPSDPLYIARLSQGGPVNVGDSVQVELWEGWVTRLGGESTTDNPANDPKQGTLIVIGLLLLPLGLGGTAWGIVEARRHARGAHDQGTATPSMTPVALSDIFSR